MTTRSGNRDFAPWTLVVGGDWLPMGDHLKWLLDDPVSFYGDLLPIFQEAELTALNIECVLGASNATGIVKDGPNLRVPKETTASLNKLSLKLACLANNHSFDFGEEGLNSTITVLRSFGIETVGAGANANEARRPVTFHLGGARVALINLAEGEEGCAAEDRAGVSRLDYSALSQIEAMKSDSDVIIIISHAGRELLPFPPPYVRRMYRALVDAGASLVIGHHPHVSQGIEVYRGVPIAYSLGNFVFWDANSDIRQRTGHLLRVRFLGSELQTYETIPYLAHSDRLSLLRGEELKDYWDHQLEVNAIAQSEAQSSIAWNEYTDAWLRSQFIEELANCVANLGRPGILVRSLLEAYRTRLDRSKLINRLARRLIGLAISALNARLEEQILLQLPKVRSAHQDEFVHSAAVLRNRFDTLAHKELYLAGLKRLVEGEWADSPTSRDPQRRP